MQRTLHTLLFALVLLTSALCFCFGEVTEDGLKKNVVKLEQEVVEVFSDKQERLVRKVFKNHEGDVVYRIECSEWDDEGNATLWNEYDSDGEEVRRVKSRYVNGYLVSRRCFWPGDDNAYHVLRITRDADNFPKTSVESLRWFNPAARRHVERRVMRYHNADKSVKEFVKSNGVSGKPVLNELKLIGIVKFKDGSFWDYRYDKQGFLYAVVEHATRKKIERYTYYKRGRRIWTVDEVAGKGVVRILYDRNDEPFRIEHRYGMNTSEYDERGNWIRKYELILNGPNGYDMKPKISEMNLYNSERDKHPDKRYHFEYDKYVKLKSVVEVNEDLEPVGYPRRPTDLERRIANDFDWSLKRIEFLLERE
ncbi:MAG: hypothetical protein U5N86_00670 [Planctomycetota bacterium]|nr:hypothetical protein [Planctomycetota bacterium]